MEYLPAHRGVRIVLVEKTDRLYRNLKDWITLDELDLETHFVKERAGPDDGVRSKRTILWFPSDIGVATSISVRLFADRLGALGSDRLGALRADRLTNGTV